MNSKIQDYLIWLDAAANAITVYVTFKDSKLRLPAKMVKNDLRNQQAIEQVLSELFIRKRVMYFEYHREQEKDCIDSLIDLRNKCDIMAERFYAMAGSINDDNHFFALAVSEWGNACDTARKEIFEIRVSNVPLKKVLKTFRLRTYPIVALLIHSLPAGNLRKDEAQREFECGLKNSGISLDQLIKRMQISQ